MYIENPKVSIKETSRANKDKLQDIELIYKNHVYILAISTLEIKLRKQCHLQMGKNKMHRYKFNKRSIGLL